jgi:hypothetical protein
MSKRVDDVLVTTSASNNAWQFGHATRRHSHTLIEIILLSSIMPCGAVLGPVLINAACWRDILIKKAIPPTCGVN